MLATIASLRAQLAAHESACSALRLAIDALDYSRVEKSLVGQRRVHLSDKRRTACPTSVGQALDSLSDKRWTNPYHGTDTPRLLNSEISSSSEFLSDLELLDSEAAAESDAREGNGLSDKQSDKEESLVGQALGQTHGQTLGQALDKMSDKRPGQALLSALAGCWDGVGGVSTSGSMRSRIAEVVPQLELLARNRGVDPVALFSAAVSRFKADPVTRSRRFGLRVLLSQLEQWCDDAPAVDTRSPEDARAERHRQRTALETALAAAERDAHWGDTDEVKARAANAAATIRDKLAKLNGGGA